MMINTDKLLVLDMDGVVNSNNLIKKWLDSHWNKNKKQHPDYTDEQLFKCTKEQYIETFVHCEELVFPQLAKNITEIVKQTNCYILWSSSWRNLPRYQKIESAKDMFNRRGLPGDKLIGYTPSRMCDGGNRGALISCWLHNNTYGTFKRVAVVDDRYDAGDFLPDYCKFFQTNETRGITKSITKKVISFLNNKENE